MRSAVHNGLLSAVRRGLEGARSRHMPQPDSFRLNPLHDLPLRLYVGLNVALAQGGITCLCSTP